MSYSMENASTNASPSSHVQKQCYIELFIASASVLSDSPVGLKVKWAWKDKKTMTKELSVDHNNREAKFNAKYKITNGKFTFNTSEESWVSTSLSQSSLTLFCDGETVGSVQFDLVNYIGG